MVSFSFSFHLFMNSWSVWNNYERMKNLNENNGISTYAVFFSFYCFYRRFQHSLAPTKHNTTQHKIHRSLLCMYVSPPSHISHTFTVSRSETVDWHWKFVTKCHFTAYSMFDVSVCLPLFLYVCVCVCVFVICWRNFVRVSSSDAFHISHFSHRQQQKAWKRKRRRKRKNQIDTPIESFELGCIHCNYIGIHMRRCEYQ